MEINNHKIFITRYRYSSECSLPTVPLEIRLKSIRAGLAEWIILCNKHSSIMENAGFLSEYFNSHQGVSLDETKNKILLSFGAFKSPDIMVSISIPRMDINIPHRVRFILNQLRTVPNLLDNNTINDISNILVDLENSINTSTYIDAVHYSYNYIDALINFLSPIHDSLGEPSAITYYYLDPNEFKNMDSPVSKKKFISNILFELYILRYNYLNLSTPQLRCDYPIEVISQYSNLIVFDSYGNFSPTSEITVSSGRNPTSYVDNIMILLDFESKIKNTENNKEEQNNQPSNLSLSDNKPPINKTSKMSKAEEMDYVIDYLKTSESGAEALEYLQSLNWTKNDFYAMLIKYHSGDPKAVGYVNMIMRHSKQVMIREIVSTTVQTRLNFQALLNRK